MLIQDESQKSIGHSTRVYVKCIALATKVSSGSGSSGYGGNSYGNGNFGGNGNKNKGKDKPVCSHCGLTGHIVEKCYELQGYPSGYKAKGKNPMANQVGNSEFRANFGVMELNSMLLQQSLSPQQAFPFATN